ncbi:MAG: MBL fold metallo-hydrolase [Myxococcota bacterium]|nr:MBL fold metallo-hydrolase [Myxococcota bacterium]
MFFRFIIVILTGCSTLEKPVDPNASVFESDQGDSHIIQVGDTTAASYLLRSDKNELVIIDTGGSDNNPVLAQLAAEGASPDDVKKVFLTHAHGNHIGGIHLFPNAKIYALESERSALAEKGIALDVGLNDNQILYLGSSELEILAVPGHSMGNAAYRFDDLLIMGDSAVARSDGTIEPILSNADDPQLAHESLIQLKNELESRQSQFAYMLFSHSESLAGIEALLQYE